MPVPGCGCYSSAHAGARCSLPAALPPSFILAPMRRPCLVSGRWEVLALLHIPPFVVSSAQSAVSQPSAVSEATSSSVSQLEAACCSSSQQSAAEPRRTRAADGKRDGGRATTVGAAKMGESVAPPAVTMSVRCWGSQEIRPSRPSAGANSSIGAPSLVPLRPSRVATRP
eukprot:scaffold9517_cov117-Isochrysis_galbana.AAC.4